MDFNLEVSPLAVVGVGHQVDVGENLETAAGVGVGVDDGVLDPGPGPAGLHTLESPHQSGLGVKVRGLSQGGEADSGQWMSHLVSVVLTDGQVRIVSSTSDPAGHVGLSPAVPSSRH